MEEAKAWRLREEKQTKKGEFKSINPRTFGELAEQFGLAETTVNRNYNEAISYHKLRKPKLPKRKPDEKKEGTDVETEGEMSKTSTPRTLQETGTERGSSPDRATEIIKMGEAPPKVPLVLKHEPDEQMPCPESEDV